MNNELHHRWNEGRDPSRKSGDEGPQVRKEGIAKNAVLLKQVGPNQGKKG